MRVTIHEHDDDIPGFYQCRGVVLNVAASTGIQTFDYTWPIPIALYSAEFTVKPENLGDDVEVMVGPNTTIGAITADVAATDAVFTVQQSVIDNIARGRWLNLFDGINNNDCGRVLSVDLTTLQVTVETAAVNSFLAATPTYVQTTAKMLYEYEFQAEGYFTLGESKIGGSKIPAGMPLRFAYNNVDGQAKKFVCHLEYTY